jgi:hypothetical protein
MASTRSAVPLRMVAAMSSLIAGKAVLRSAQISIALAFCSSRWDPEGLAQRWHTAHGAWTSSWILWITVALHSSTSRTRMFTRLRRARVSATTSGSAASEAHR